MERKTRFLCEAQLLNVLADGLPGIVAYFDRDGRCRFVNSVIEDWRGLTQTECLDRDIEQVFGPFSEAMKPAFERSLAGGHVEFEAPADYLRSTINVVRGFIYPDANVRGDVEGVFVLLLDITRERAFEHELKLARDAAVTATRSKSGFLAAASHDLRQPLQAMTLFVSALERRVVTPDQKRLVGDLDTSLRSLRGMIDALLNISKLDSGLVAPNKSVFRLQDLFDGLTPGFQALANERGLALKVLPTSAIVQADKALIETCLRNLMANAFKFTERGRVLVGVVRQRGRIGIMVCDSGTGMSPDNLKGIFTEFERAKTTPHGANEGIGLGLAIVKRLLALHGGDVTVSSKLGRGSAFTLWLPDLMPQVQRPQLRWSSETVSIANRRVMVLDDDTSCAEALQREFQDFGAYVVAATSIADAERSILAGGVPEAMVIDYNLGEHQTGLEFLADLQRLRGRTRAVMVTGSTDSETIAALRASGVPWLTKPVDPQVLRNTLVEALNR
jgi:signal transduction histidine kinase